PIRIIGFDLRGDFAYSLLNLPGGDEHGASRIGPIRNRNRVIAHKAVQSLRAASEMQDSKAREPAHSSYGEVLNYVKLWPDTMILRAERELAIPLWRAFLAISCSSSAAVPCLRG